MLRRLLDGSSPWLVPMVFLRSLRIVLRGWSNRPNYDLATKSKIWAKLGPNQHIRKEAMPDAPSSVLSLAAQIVSAHVANNSVTADQLPKLINDVHQALATVGQVAAEQPKAEPVVPIKKSVFGDHLVCLDCGKHFSMLKRHLMTDHQMTPDQYRQKWGLSSSYPVVSPNYAKVRSALAKKIGLGRGTKAAKKVEKTATRRK